MGRPLHVEDVQVADVGAGMPALCQRRINHTQKILHRQRVQPRLHPFRVGHIQLVAPAAMPSAVSGSRAARRDDHVERERAVHQQGRAQYLVARVVLAQQQRAAARAQVDQEARSRVGVHQVAVAIASGDEHGVDMRVGGHQALGQLDRADGGAAPHLHVDGPGPRGAQIIGQLDARRPDGIFFPLLGGAEHHVDCIRRNPGLGQRGWAALSAIVFGGRPGREWACAPGRTSARSRRRGCPSRGRSRRR